MELIKAIVVDDEKQSRVSLIGDLNSYCPQIEIIGEAHSVKTAVENISYLKPDVVFLDIELGDGTGFNILEQLNNRDFKVIFTTAYNEYAIKAFRFSAIDYLLKPIDADELVAAVNKIEIKYKSNNESLKALLENIKPENKNKKVVFKTTEGLHIYQLKDLVRCEADGNYTKIFFDEDPMLLISKTMKEIEEMLDTNRFERTHQSHIVNLDYIKQFVSKDGGYLLMQNGESIPVAQRKRSELVTKLENWS